MQLIKEMFFLAECKTISYDLSLCTIFQYIEENIHSCMPFHNYLLRFHLYVIGTEECERSIAQSAVNASKRVWEAFLANVLGPMYVPLRSHTLQVRTYIFF